MIKAYQGGTELAQIVRSGFVEGFHRGSAVILDADGAVRGQAGDIESPVFARSSSKPMQTLGAVRSGLPFTAPADLALASASHAGEKFHIDAVLDLLKRAGLGVGDLQCPPAWPRDEDAHREAVKSGEAKARTSMNCSGKHAAMLATCKAAGWSTVDYLDTEHPLQLANAQAAADATGYDIAATGVDGCGAPLFAYPLLGLARAFLTFVSAEPGSHERAIADGMRAYPELVSGTHGFDTRLMRAVPGLLSKIGAEGVQAVALPGVGAVAVKIDDGNNRASGPVAVAALRNLGAPSGTDERVLDELASTPLLGGGEPVGAVQPVWPN